MIYKDQALIDERENLLNTKKNKNLENPKNCEKKIEYDDIICNVCNYNKINIVFRDCRHRFCCEDCIDKISKVCKICSKIIRKFVRLYNV